MQLNVGDRAPTLNPNIQSLLTNPSGRPVVLAFYPVTFGFMTGIGG
jgi:peroxiredoxin